MLWPPLLPLWTKINSVWIIIKRKIVTTIIFTNCHNEKCFRQRKRISSFLHLRHEPLPPKFRCHWHEPTWTKVQISSVHTWRFLSYILFTVLFSLTFHPSFHPRLTLCSLFSYFSFLTCPGVSSVLRYVLQHIQRLPCHFYLVFNEQQQLQFVSSLDEHVETQLKHHREIKTRVLIYS